MTAPLPNYQGETEMDEGNTIYDVIGYGAIIDSVDDIGSIITWNGGATFLWWNLTGRENRLHEMLWSNDDIRTVYDVTTLRQAETVAREWIEDALSDGEDD